MYAAGYANAYNRVSIQSTERKEEIVLLLYEKAITCARQVRQGIEAGCAKTRGENVSRAVAILSELDCALDRSLDLEMVENLSALYQYMIQQLTFANVRNEASALDSVEGLLRELYEAFQQAAQQVKNADGAATAHPVPEEAVEGGLRAAV